MAALAGIGGLLGLDSGVKLTLKGYGWASQGASAYSMSFGNIVSGAAPAAGDLVIWHAHTGDTATSGYADLTAAGWVGTSYKVAGANAWHIAWAKVVTAGDLSSPPAVKATAVSVFAVSSWVAYTPSRPIASLAAGGVQSEFTSVVPANQVHTPAGTPAAFLSCGYKYNTIGVMTLAVSPGAFGVDFQVLDKGSGVVDIRWGVQVQHDGVVPVAQTISSADDGSNNIFGSFDLTIT
jgi:hypothetical protein